MLRVNAFSDKTLGRHPLKELWRQVKSLLGKSESIKDHRFHRLTDRDFPLLEVLGDMLVDSVANFQFLGTPPETRPRWSRTLLSGSSPSPRSVAWISSDRIIPRFSHAIVTSLICSFIAVNGLVPSRAGVSKVGYEGSMVRVFGRFPAAMRLVALNP